MTAERTVIIGSGLAGLTAACRLASRGIETVVLEKRPAIGGYNTEWAAAGYRFDIGATMLQTPQVLDEVFESFEEDVHDHLDLVPLDPLYRVWFPDDRWLDLAPSSERTAEGIAAFSSADARGFLRYMDEMARFKRTLKAFFIDRDASIVPTLSRGQLAMMRALSPLRSVAQLVSRYFTTDHVRTAFSFQVLYWGVPPSRCPAVYGMVPYFEVSQGVWHVRGGLHSISRALADVYARRGGTIETNTPVREILTARGRVCGVLLESGDVLEASAVISNADALYTYQQLVAPDVLPGWFRSRLARVATSSSAQVALLGIKGAGAIASLPHHTFAMPIELSGICRDLFELRRLPPATYAYLCQPTYTDATVAPADRTALYALTLLPYRVRDMTWDEFRPHAARRVVVELQRRGVLGGDVELDYEQVFLPPDFAREFNQPRGQGFGIQPTLRQIGPMRLAARSRHVRGLYLAGASTNPGGGIPLVLASGRQAADALIADGHRGGPIARARPPRAAVPPLRAQEGALS